MNTRQLVADLMYLTRCALHDESPDENRVKVMSLPHIFQMAKMHSMSAITWAGLADAQGQCPPDLAAAWKEAAEMATRKALLLSIGREEMFAALEDAGIWYLPLKGSLLQDLYPAPGLREMSDNDILFDRTRRQEVAEIMTGLGYQVKWGAEDDHDVYTKPPVYNYEMHLFIMGEKYTSEKTQYYANFEEKLLSNGDGSAYRFVRDEDFYIHMIAHAHSHYTTGGIGLRMFADIHVWMQEKEAELDWGYVAAELEKMNILAFERRLQLVTQRLFDAPHNLTQQDWNMLDFCTESGTHGSFGTKAENLLRSLQEDGKPITLKTKLRFLWRRLWPDKKTCQYFFPFFAKYPILKPFLMIFRIFRALFIRRGLVSSELKAMSKADSR